jgi:hypothetical protein
LFTLLSACNSIGSSASTNKTLWIGAETRTCTGVVEMQCMLYKENKNQTEWFNFYDNIEGFAYEKGYLYELEVKVEDIKNPPADASSKRYTLVRVVSKTKV